MYNYVYIYVTLNYILCLSEIVVRYPYVLLPTKKVKRATG